MQSAAGHGQEKEAIRQVVENYTRSISTLDPGLASRVWVCSDEARMLSPAGQYDGYQNIYQNFYQGAMASLYSKRELKALELDIRLLSETVAVTLFHWELKAIRAETGEEHFGEGKETQILLKGEDGWRILHVHYSSIPQK